MIQQRTNNGMNTSGNGFSLVELSIVLVILGLLVGGVLTGKSLIRASELRSIGTQRAQFITAIKAFQNQYFYLPGDMPNATNFWGAINPGAPDCNSGASTPSILTCNGDGDGRVYGKEDFIFWQHLANAGLIAGQYQGYTGTGASSTNSPAGSISHTLWAADYVPDNTLPLYNNQQYFNGNYGHTLYFGGQAIP